MTAPYNQRFFNNIANNFDHHVARSIPLFTEFQDNVVRNIARYKGQSILDVCGSTGQLGRLLVNAGWKGGYTCLDGSKEMKQVFDSYPFNESLRFKLAGFMASWEDIQLFREPGTFDIAIECLGFQFFTKGRAKELDELKRISKLCIIFEKFNTDEETFRTNEELKEPFKSLSFTKEEQEQKEDTVLAAMSDYCYDARAFDKLIKSRFKHVKVIARIGNFVGYIATDKKELLQDWIINTNLIDNQYNEDYYVQNTSVRTERTKTLC